VERIGDAVRSELGRFGTAGAMADVVEAWPAAVGEAVAANAWPARLARDGTLHVAASSSAWAFELGQLEREIVTRLGEALGAECHLAKRGERRQRDGDDLAARSLGDVARRALSGGGDVDWSKPRGPGQ